jgi:alanyl-tRNA synthetase
MTSRRLDYDDAYTTRFRARVAGSGEHRGRTALELEATYFYPESGGQEADRGTLGGRPVVDVQADDDGRVWHVIESGDPPGGEVDASIDWPRRFDHMQQHTGQHILSAAFERVLGAATLSSSLGEERDTIDVALDAADWSAVERVEEAANRIVWEDRPVERHWADDEGVKRFALRKPPAVRGRIRIVEIPEWDVSACGGTHTRRTGEVGVIKVTHWERVRNTLRFEFHCGARALRDHAWRTQTLLEAAKRRSIADRDLVAHLERAASERDELRKRVRALTLALLAHEARAEVGHPPRGVGVCAPDRAREEVRLFALQCLEAGAPWVVSAARGPEPALVAGRAKGLELDLRAMLPELLARAGGRGGGSPDLVQVTAGDAASLDDAYRWAATELATRAGAPA